MVSQVPFLPGKLFACSTFNKAITNYGIPRDWISLNFDSTTFYGIPGAMFFPGKLYACSTNFFCFRILTAGHYRGGGTGIFFHFFKKVKFSMHPPFSNFIFSKSSCAPTCKFSDRSDQQFLRKLTFFVKKWHFKKMHFLVKISTLGKASALRFSPAFSASSFLVVCQILAPKLFSMLRNVCFFDRK